jgi:hypothetical protein
MDETMPDAAPLSQRFLASLASFMAAEHGPLGEGDISAQVKGAIAQAQSSTVDPLANPGPNSAHEPQNSPSDLSR